MFSDKSITSLLFKSFLYSNALSVKNALKR
nr:MAG TPA: hypothetical protein [Caudoviricetes sp.]